MSYVCVRMEIYCVIIVTNWNNHIALPHFWILILEYLFRCSGTVELGHMSRN